MALALCTAPLSLNPYTASAAQRDSAADAVADLEEESHNGIG